MGQDKVEMVTRLIRLERVVAQNFRCFELLDMRLGARVGTPEDRHSGLTVIVAKNGQGKTAVLDALRYLLARYVSKFKGIKTLAAKETDFRSMAFRPSLETGKVHQSNLNDALSRQTTLQDPLDMKFKAQAEFMGLTAFLRKGTDGDGEPPWLRWDTIRRRDKTAETKRVVTAHGAGVGMQFLGPYVDQYIRSNEGTNPWVYPILAAYGTDRKLIRQKSSRIDAMRKTSQRHNMYVDCLHAGLNYRQLVEWMFRLENRQLREAKERKDFDYATIEQKTVELAISKMLPGFSNLRTTGKSLSLQVDVEEDGVKNARLVDEQLSDGFKIVLSMVVDIVSRILEGNAQLNGMTPDGLLDVPGIVLIDEIDLHLHPSWQQRIIPDLRRTFPNIQFIVTTHSPQVVSSVPRECIRILDHGLVRTIAKQTEGVESQMILADIFGVDSVSQDNQWVQKLERYAQLMSMGNFESDESNRLSSELDAHYGARYQPLVRIRLLSRLAKKTKEEP